MRIGVNHKRVPLHGVTGTVSGTFGTLVSFKVSTAQDREIVRKEYPKSARTGAILVAAKCLEKLHA